MRRSFLVRSKLLRYKKPLTLPIDTLAGSTWHGSTICVIWCKVAPDGSLQVCCIAYSSDRPIQLEELASVRERKLLRSSPLPVKAPFSFFRSAVRPPFSLKHTPATPNRGYGQHASQLSFPPNPCPLSRLIQDAHQRSVGFNAPSGHCSIPPPPGLATQLTPASLSMAHMPTMTPRSPRYSTYSGQQSFNMPSPQAPLPRAPRFGSSRGASKVGESQRRPYGKFKEKERPSDASKSRPTKNKPAEPVIADGSDEGPL